MSSETRTTAESMTIQQWLDLIPTREELRDPEKKPSNEAREAHRDLIEALFENAEPMKMAGILTDVAGAMYMKYPREAVTALQVSYEAFRRDFLLEQIPQPLRKLIGAILADE